MRHAAFSILPPFSILFEFSVHSASVYLAKMSSDEFSDSEMPYNSSDEEVWEEEEVSGDDDSDGGPGFLDPTRRHSLPGMQTVPSLSDLTKEGMIRLTADQLYYQHFLSPKPKPVYVKIDGLWPITTATGLLARDREYFWIRLQPSFRVAYQRGGAYGWKRCVVEWSIDGRYTQFVVGIFSWFNVF